jgi:hypothetical protein
MWKRRSDYFPYPLFEGRVGEGCEYRQRKQHHPSIPSAINYGGVFYIEIKTKNPALSYPAIHSPVLAGTGNA